MNEMIANSTTCILGRTSYEEWAGFWPNAGSDGGFADFINPVEKLVASRTLGPDLAWQNSSVIPGDLIEFVTTLKQGDGGDTSICSSISVVRQLFFAGLIDSLKLMTHPVIAGSGKRLFEPGDPTTRLTLQSSQQTSKGNTIATYGLRQD